MPVFSRNFLLLHLIVFLWGWTAILGKVITVSAIDLIWYRTLIAVGVIFVYLKLVKVPLKASWPSLMKFFGVGVIVALHWFFFYEAIKVSNVSVTLACFASGTLFTSLFEPLFFKRRIVPVEIIFGLMIIAGIYMIFRFESKYVLGMVYSLISASLSSLFTVLNGLLIRNNDSRIISFYELMGVFLSATVFLGFSGGFNSGFFSISQSDLGYLFLLATACTAFTFIISVEIMKEINPFTVVLTVNLEPIYGIVFAYLLFNDEKAMTTGFYIGSVIVLGTIFLNAALKKYFQR